MKNSNRHTIKVPFDLDAQIQKKRIQSFEKEGTMPSFGELLIEYARIGMNGNDPEKIVSPAPEDTISDKPNPDIAPPIYDRVTEGWIPSSVPDSVPKNVSPAPEDTDSKSFEFNLD